MVAGIAFAAVMITHLVNFGTDDLRIRWLDANSDASWSHLLIAATLVAVTAIAVVGTARSSRQATLWGAAAAVFAFLSVDEISSLHARFDQMSWGKLVYAPILFALVLCLWRLSDRSERSIALRAGLATLLISFGIHVFGPHIVHALGYGSNTWAYQVKVGLKQSTELAGWLLVLLGCWGLVFSRVPRG